MHIEDIASLLPSIQLYPFPKILNYSTSGDIIPSGYAGLVVARKAFLVCPMCKGVDDFYKCQKDAHYHAAFCPGNQAPEHEHSDIFGNSHKHQVNCAGITVSHFHIRCICCESVFFLTLPKED